MTTPDPIRWLDSDQPVLTAEQQSALVAYKNRGPSEAQRARLLSRLSGAPLSSPAHGAFSRLRWWWGAGGLVVLCALLLTRLEHSAPLAEQKPASAPVLPAPSAPVPARAAPATPPSEAPHAPLTPATPAARATARTTRASKPGAAPRPQDPTAELLLLTPARQLLATTPARSLALADEHAHRFPRGVFAEERAFLRIEALLRLGQRGHAASEARAFRRSHPQSTYLERLDSLLPIAKPSDDLR